MKWTTDQQKIIDARDKNILVSAAAGSGKTAVLVERIISLITEGENPIDVDRLLIVTFTNAAAAEMKERIGKAIDKKVREQPDNPHLQKQITLIHSAQITTIHSFCLNVIRNHFTSIDLDPGFRIAEDAELVLLKSDVLSDLLEVEYEKGEESFLTFVESFTSGKTDTPLEDLILRLHQFSMSYPWPKEWLEEIKDTFSMNTMEDMMNMEWMKALTSYLSIIFKDLSAKCKDELMLCNQFDGPQAYIPAIESDRELLIQLSRATNYLEYESLLREFTFARLSTKKDKEVSPQVKERVKAMRDEVKDILKKIKESFFFQSSDEMYTDIVAMKEPMEVLIRLTMDFMDAYAKKKEEKNIVDFGDLEHFALKILIKREDGKEEPTDAAMELSEFYHEIMIDEYQDSNYVQETILKSISKGRLEKGNLFMVGDVKQSIYKFRLARPELFMEKFNTYPTDENASSMNQRIDLHKNFRSRTVVIDSINFIFEQIMTEKLGNIVYNHDAALHPGADFGEYQEGVSEDTEIIIVPLDEEEEDGSSESIIKDYDSEEEKEEEEDYTGKELEAKIIGKRIKELTHKEHGLLIFDKETGGKRIAKPSDIVILLRSMSGYSEVFIDTLLTEGISAYADKQSGYFQTLEIRTILNLLRIIDNPRQDIPFASILRSPIVELSSDELARIRLAKKKVSMYEAVKAYIEQCREEKEVPIVEESETEKTLTEKTITEEERILCDKLQQFMNQLDWYRDIVSYFTIYELILKVLDDTGYYNFISAMPNGAKRRANVDMLLERAVRFESTSYSGLFQFVRYMEKLNKYDIDYGEANVASEDDSTVQIMSIHKSKGLEFQIVFVAGMGKEFNNQDSRASVLMHPDLGLGPDFLDDKLRVKAPTLVKKTIQKLLVLENLAEELRILYVALTRAKEKLILVGGMKKIESKLGKWSDVLSREEKQLLYYQISSAKSYFDWILPATMRHRAFATLLEEASIGHSTNDILYHSDASLSIKKLTLKDFIHKESAIQTFQTMNKDELLQWDNDKMYNESIRREIEEQMEFVYPYELEAGIKAKLTVSELKRLGQAELEEEGDLLIKKEKKESDVIEVVPKFVKQSVRGVDIGTLYHTVLECMDYEDIHSVYDMNNKLLELVNNKKITMEEFHTLDAARLYQFTTTNIAKRMLKAKANDMLYKEKQFVMGVKAYEINPSLKSEELVLVQGVIDVYFMEDDEYVLLDYKTDGVSPRNGAKLLSDRYKIQLDYYEKALEQITGGKVKEKLIYSFALNQEIAL